jgi:hypothetical protein
MKGVCVFDYDQIEDTALADDMRVAAGRVREHVRASVIEVGRELMAVKARTQHGDFVAWVETECGLPIRTAQRAMRAAEFVDRTKHVNLSFLPTDGLLAIASIPSRDDADRIVERIDRGELTTAYEIKAAIGKLHAKRRNLTGGAKNTGVGEEPVRCSSAPLAEEADVGTGRPEVWLVARSQIDPEPVDAEIVWPPRIEREVQVETQDRPTPLAVAIHAIESLSEDDLAAFNRWYRNTFAASAAKPLKDETPPRDDEEVLAPTPERLPEPDMVEIEDDLLIAMWRDFKPNPQKCGRAWVLDGGPAEVSSGEHFVITERLAPWRDAYRVAPPDRQQSIRQWLEQQRL